MGTELIENLDVPWLSVSRVAKRLGVSSTTVIRFIERGELAATRIGDPYKIAPADLRTYLQERQVKAKELPVEVAA